jgi:NADH-quinone oxidoreductase subunit C
VSDTASLIEAALPGAVVAEFEHRGELTIEIAPQRLREVAEYVKGPPLAFGLLSDVSCADFPDEPGRFRVAYHLFSLENGARLRLRAWAGADEPELPSVCSVWPTANWHEREVWDMFGVRFADHPDLSRILMPVDWEGHPLRRDYPLGGEDVIFSDEV